MEPAERFDLHIRVEHESVEALDVLIREYRPYVIRVGPVQPAGQRYALDALVTSDLRARLEQAGYKVEVLARVNQVDDLAKQVSQTNRFAALLGRLKKRRP